MGADTKNYRVGLQDGQTWEVQATGFVLVDSEAVFSNACIAGSGPKPFRVPLVSIRFIADPSVEVSGLEDAE